MTLHKYLTEPKYLLYDGYTYYVALNSKPTSYLAGQLCANLYKCIILIMLKNHVEVN